MALWRNKVALLVLLMLPITVLVAIILAAGQSKAEQTVLFEQKPLRLLMLGDSLVQGYGLLQGEELPAQLQDALHAAEPAGRADIEIINAGVSGDTSAGGVARIDWLLADDPAGVIIVLGGNDGMRGIDPAETQRNLDRLLARLGAVGIPVLLTGMLAPPNLGADYSAQFNPLFQMLAYKHQVLFYPFILQDVVTLPELNQSDGIHPNAAGVAVIVRNLLPLVQKLIGQIKRENT